MVKIDAAGRKAIEMYIANMEYQQLVELSSEFLFKVKCTYRDQPEVHDNLVAMMCDFNNGRIESPEVFQRLSDLFREHPDLLEAFNSLLPHPLKFEILPMQQANERASDATDSSDEISSLSSECSEKEPSEPLITRTSHHSTDSSHELLRSECLVQACSSTTLPIHESSPSSECSEKECASNTLTIHSGESFHESSS